MLNYGIFGLTQTTSLYARMLRSRGCPIKALGQSDEKCENYSHFSRFCPNIPHVSQVSRHASLWSLLQDESVGGVILGGKNPIGQILTCFKSRTESVTRNYAIPCKIIALDISSLDLSESLDNLDELIALYEKDISDSAETPTKFMNPMLLTHPIFFMRHDTAVRYAAAILPQAAGPLNFISLTHMNASARSKLNHAESLHAVNLMKPILHDDLPSFSKKLTSTKGLSVQFRTPKGVLGDLAVIPGGAVDNLLLNCSGTNGMILGGDMGRARGRTTIEVWPKCKDKPDLSKSFALPMPRLFVRRSSPMETRWSDAVWGFLQSIHPQHRKMGEILAQSMKALVDLRECMKLAKILFLQ